MTVLGNRPSIRLRLQFMLRFQDSSKNELVYPKESSFSLTRNPGKYYPIEIDAVMSRPK